MACLEYVMAGLLRLRRLIVASVAAARGFRGLRPLPLPRHGGGLELGDFLPGVGGLAGRSGAEALAPFRGGFPQCP